MAVARNVHNAQYGNAITLRFFAARSTEQQQLSLRMLRGFYELRPAFGLEHYVLLVGHLDIVD